MAKVRYKKYGDKICLQGYLFRVANIRKTSTPRGVSVRFEGVATADKRNDAIRKTHYDGGMYGAFGWMRATLADN